MSLSSLLPIIDIIGNQMHRRRDLPLELLQVE
jgi:hypothetical protein